MSKKTSSLTIISLVGLLLAACVSPSTTSPTVESPTTVPTSKATATNVPTAEATATTVVAATATATTAATDPSADAEPVVAVVYPVVDTGQGICYDDSGEQISCPAEGEAFYGQDAQYTGAEFVFQDNGDGTVTDLNTGLMWQVTPSSQSFSYEEAVEYAENLELAGYDDWRLPSTKELFSISDFSEGWPYLDTDVFDIAGNSVSKDEQYWTEYYVGLTHGGSVSAFGVNHGTGHIKSYPVQGRGNYVRVVRGETYGINDFVDNGDGTVTDLATGLMWSQDDSGVGMDWEDALAYAEGSELAGYDDWRLPSVKELQSILDYSKSPNAIDSDDLGPAIDVDFFNITALASGTTAYDPDYGYFCTSTSAYQNARSPGYYYAWYVAFGTAVDPAGDDTHGAGGVRFDTKVEDGPDGEDAARIFNYVRLVRGGDVTETVDGDPTADDTVASVESADSGSSAPPAGQPTDSNGQPPTGNQPPSGNQPPGPGGQGLDLAAAAAQLNVTEEALQAALGDPNQGPPDFAAAAQALGVSEADLLAALGMPADGQPPTGGQRPGGGQPPAGQPPANRP